MCLVLGIAQFERRRRQAALLDCPRDAPAAVLLPPEPDGVDPERGRVVPAIFRTDGTRVWSDQIAYYLDRYGFAPELRRHFCHAPGAETSGHGSASQRGRPAGAGRTRGFPDGTSLLRNLLVGMRHQLGTPRVRSVAGPRAMGVPQILLPEAVSDDSRWAR
ncbi:hypothetical protein GCM10009536_09730 [Streptomyces thermocarboxydus]